MEFMAKFMGPYELILKLDGALWLTIISKTPLTPRKATKDKKSLKNPNGSEKGGNPCTRTNETWPYPPLVAWGFV